MKSIKTIALLLLCFVFSATVQAQEKKTDKTEQTATEYKKGDQFDSVDYGTLTLVSERNIQGLATWTTKAEKDGKTRTLYVPVTYLATCKKIDNQKEGK